MEESPMLEPDDWEQLRRWEWESPRIGPQGKYELRQALEALSGHADKGADAIRPVGRMDLFGP
jgi:hypothetical protein